VLAQHESAIGLLEGADVGRDIGRTALAALPYAEDAELALFALCGWVKLAPPERVLLLAIQGIANRPPEPTETLDPSGYARCEEVLSGLELSNVSPSDRDVVQSALAMLAEHRRLPAGPRP
jgi:hypothetical protein